MKFVISSKLEHFPKPGVPNLGYMYAKGYICLSEGVHLRLAIEDKIYLYIIYFQYLYIYQLILLSKSHYRLIVKCTCE